MANLVVWASGLIEVLAEKDTPPIGGAVTVMQGMTGKLISEVSVLGEFDPELKAWFVPGTLAMKTPEERLGPVMEFGHKLKARADKRKGRRHIDGGFK